MALDRNEVDRLLGLIDQAARHVRVRLDEGSVTSAASWASDLYAAADELDDLLTDAAEDSAPSPSVEGGGGA